MNKKLLSILVAAAVVIVGVAAFIITNDDTGDNQNTAESSSPQQAQSTPEFNAQATSNQPFVAKMVTTTDQGKIEATIQSDGQGNTHYLSQMSGNNIEMYMTKQGIISCQSGQCIKLSQSQSGQTVNSDTYEYNADDIKNFRDHATYKGQQGCPAGTCSVWEVEDNSTSYTTEVFLASDGKVSKLTSNGPEGNIEVTYEYKPVSFTVPTNVKSIPTSPSSN